MNVEFFLDLCFIREHEPEPIHRFEQAVQKQLDHLFSGTGSWYTEGKQQDQADIVVAEVKGMAKWQSEEDIVAYIEANAAPPFMAWLQGYRIQLDIKEAHEGCSHCGKN